MNNPLLERDDVVAAMFAAEVNRGLKYVDKQTTNRPSAQPPASRLNPKGLIEKGGGNIPPIIQRQMGEIQSGVTNINPLPLQELMIPMPEGSTITNGAESKPKNAPVEQLELGLNITEKKNPITAQEWFVQLDKKITDLEMNLELKINKVYRILDDITTKKRKINARTKAE